MYAEVLVDVIFSLFGSVPKCVLVLSHGNCVMWFAKELPNFFQKWLSLQPQVPFLLHNSDGFDVLSEL